MWLQSRPSTPLLHQASHTLRCRSPPAAALAAGTVALHLSLNSQNYVRAAGLSFTYTPPLAPAALSPSAGPSEGSTLVTVAVGTVAGGGVEPTCMFGIEVTLVTMALLTRTLLTMSLLLMARLTMARLTMALLTR